MTRHPALSLGLLALLLAVAVHAAPPPGRYTVAADTVYDTVTQLTWERNPPTTGSPFAATQQACQTLNLGGFSTGWRLPTISELESLVDWSRYNPAIDAATFPATQGEVYWSSTLSSTGATSVWGVDFYHGNAHTQSATSSGWRRCVR